MFLRLTVGIISLIIFPTSVFSETINLRNACETWQYIPANEALKSPVAALLQCGDENGIRLALQIMCFTETAEIEFRYRPGYPIIAPVPPATKTNNDAEPITGQPDGTKTVEPEYSPLGSKEMLFFDFPKLGVTSVVNYDFDAGDWHYREKEPLSPLFSSLISGNYADVNFLAADKTERLPLRGSTKALGPVVEACRIAKIKRDKKLAQAILD